MSEVKDCSTLIYIIDELAKKDFKGGLCYKDTKLPYIVNIETSLSFNKETYCWELTMKYQSNPTVIFTRSNFEENIFGVNHHLGKGLEIYTKKLIDELRKEYDADVTKKIELPIILIKTMDFTFNIILDL